MDLARYVIVKTIFMEGITVTHYSLLPEYKDAALSAQKAPSCLVATRNGKAIWNYEPYDPKDGKVYDIWGVFEKKDNQINVTTNCTKYGYNYYIDLDANTGLVTNTFLSK
jgi:hypothetical protein